jgi:hypothetical protein
LLKLSDSPPCKKHTHYIRNLNVKQICVRFFNGRMIWISD